MKKIKALWKRLFKKPILMNCTTDPGTVFHVIEIDPSSDILSEVLGISEERKKYLNRKVSGLFHSTTTLIAVMVEISQEVKHANELYYVSHVLACLQKDNEPPPIIRALMQGRG